MWNINTRYEERKQHYESIRREVEAYRLARKLGYTDAATLRFFVARLRNWLFGFRHMLHHRLAEKDTIMDDFDAKNHLRDLHREANNERLAQLVEAGAEVKKPKVAQRSVFSVAVRLLAWMFAQTRRAAR